jgi:hypothetical protein
MRTVTVLGVLSTIASIIKLVFMNFLLLLLAAFGRKTRASRTQWSLLRLLRRRRVSHAMRAKIQLFFQIARIILRILTLFAHKKCSFFHGSRYIMYGNIPEQLNSITNDEQKSFVLAVGGDAADGV